MQSDIKLPKLRRPKAAPKPKPQQPPAEPEPDFEVDEASLDAQPAQEAGGRFSLRRHHRSLRDWWAGLGRRQRFGLLIAGIIVAGGAIWYWVYFIYGQPQIATISYVPHAKPKPKTVPSPLTGLQVSPQLAARPVTAVMIENSNDARPQSGLQDAGIVFEAIAEGGVTRFVALYQEATPQYIGPVRSLRPYFLDFAAPFQASIAHVGGSPDALAKVRNGQYRDIDQFFNAGYYWRSASRYAPHNVYTSFAKLDALNRSKGYTKSTFTPWPRNPDKKLKKAAAANKLTAVSIDIPISGPDYYVHYDYNPKTANYLRKEAGSKHLDIVDAAGKKVVQLQPRVVVAMAITRTLGSLDASGAYYSNYQDVGSGPADIFQDGGVTQVTWKKSSASAPLQFIGSDGQPFKLDSGQTWITAINSLTSVSYKP